MTDPGAPALLGAAVTGHRTADSMRSGVPGLADPYVAEATVTQLYKENAPFVLAYVRGLLSDRQLAEDVVQETMLRAWRHCGGFSAEKGSVRGWLTRVAHNIAMDTVRMRQARPTEVSQACAPEPLVGDHADQVVTALHIRQALARLSPRHRDVIEQVYLNGLTAVEAAAVLGIPEGTVFSRAYYGLHMLRRELGLPSARPRASQQRPKTGRTLAA